MRDRSLAGPKGARAFFFILFIKSNVLLLQYLHGICSFNSLFTLLGADVRIIFQGFG